MLHAVRNYLPVMCLVGLCGGFGALTGCTSLFARYYEPRATAPVSSVVASRPPLFLDTQNPEADARQLEREGYVLIGASRFITGQLFSGPIEDSFYKDQAIAQGVKVGAAIVLLHVDASNVIIDGCCEKVVASYWASAASSRS